MEYIDTKKMSNLLKELEVKEQKKYINLYKYYDLINNKYNIKSDIDMDNNYNYYGDLEKLEDKVYTINRKLLSDDERIILEIKSIASYLEKNIDKLPSDLVSYVFEELKELNELIHDGELKNSNMIDYFKKQISLLQASLGLKIKFYNAALEVFDEQIKLLMAKTDDNILTKGNK